MLVLCLIDALGDVRLTGNFEPPITLRSTGDPGFAQNTHRGLGDRTPYRCRAAAVPPKPGHVSPNQLARHVLRTS